jgi:hypothetical protein
MLRAEVENGIGCAVDAARRRNGAAGVATRPGYHQAHARNAIVDQVMQPGWHALPPLAQVVVVGTFNA